MAVRPPARKKMYRTMQGRMVDIDKLRAQNEDTPAVGNMNVNARGDVLGPGGRIAKPKEAVMREYYETPKGAVEDTPRNKVIPEPKVQPSPPVQPKQTAPAPQPVVEQPIQTRRNQPPKVIKTQKKAEPKKGIDAALDGID